MVEKKIDASTGGLLSLAIAPSIEEIEIVFPPNSLEMNSVFYLDKIETPYAFKGFVNDNIKVISYFSIKPQLALNKAATITYFFPEELFNIEKDINTGEDHSVFLSNDDGKKLMVITKDYHRLVYDPTFERGPIDTIPVLATGLVRVTGKIMRTGDIALVAIRNTQSYYLDTACKHFPVWSKIYKSKSSKGAIMLNHLTAPALDVIDEASKSILSSRIETTRDDLPDWLYKVRIPDALIKATKNEEAPPLTESDLEFVGELKVYAGGNFYEEAKDKWDFFNNNYKYVIFGRNILIKNPETEVFIYTE